MVIDYIQYLHAHVQVWYYNIPQNIISHCLTSILFVRILHLSVRTSQQDEILIHSEPNPKLIATPASRDTDKR